jgi:hypothetical protein
MYRLFPSPNRPRLTTADRLSSRLIYAELSTIVSVTWNGSGISILSFKILHITMTTLSLGLIRRPGTLTGSLMSLCLSIVTCGQAFWKSLNHRSHLATSGGTTMSNPSQSNRMPWLSKRRKARARRRRLNAPQGQCPTKRPGSDPSPALWSTTETLTTKRPGRRGTITFQLRLCHLSHQSERSQR